MSYQVLLKQNEWLNNYKGKTFSSTLADSLLKGVYEEQIPMCDILTDVKRRTLITSYDPKTLEIKSLGASALLKDKRGKIQMNLFNDNFARMMMYILGNGANATDSYKDDANTSQTIAMVGNATLSFFASAGALGKGKFGSGTSSPTRNDFSVTTALGNAPESGYVSASSPQIFLDDHITWQYVIASAGGSGTVNEFGQFNTGRNSGAVDKTIMLWHDLVNATTYATLHSISATISMQF